MSKKARVDEIKQSDRDFEKARQLREKEMLIEKKLLIEKMAKLRGGR